MNHPDLSDGLGQVCFLSTGSKLNMEKAALGFSFCTCIWNKLKWNLSYTQIISSYKLKPVYISLNLVLFIYISHCTVTAVCFVVYHFSLYLSLFEPYLYASFYIALCFFYILMSFYVNQFEWPFCWKVLHKSFNFWFDWINFISKHV